MPRYFFDIYEDGVLTTDAFGDDFDSYDDARAQAISILPDVARNLSPDGDHQEFACDVRDGSGTVVYRARLTFNGRWIEPPAS